jgi:hypothetical protein
MVINQAGIMIPVFGMLLLTMGVWLWMYALRLPWIMQSGLPPASLNTPYKLDREIPEAVNYPSYNFRNLLELPVLFYVLCLYLLWAQQVDQVHLTCAYLFLLARIVHSVIHCTINHVPLRFATYLISAFALWVMLVRSVITLFQAV